MFLNPICAQSLITKNNFKINKKSITTNVMDFFSLSQNKINFSCVQLNAN